MIKKFLFLLSLISNLNLMKSVLALDEAKKSIVESFRSELSKNSTNADKLKTIFNKLVKNEILENLGRDIIAKALVEGKDDIIDYFIKHNIKLENCNDDWLVPFAWHIRPEEIYDWYDPKGLTMSQFYHDWKATPLHWAVRSHNNDAIKYFINQGISVLAQDQGGFTPLDWIMAPLEFWFWDACHRPIAYVKYGCNIEFNALLHLFNKNINTLCHLIKYAPVNSCWYLTKYPFKKFKGWCCHTFGNSQDCGEKPNMEIDNEKIEVDPLNYLDFHFPGEVLYSKNSINTR